MNKRTLYLSFVALLLSFVFISCAAHSKSDTTSPTIGSAQTKELKNGNETAKLDHADTAANQSAVDAGDAEDPSPDDTKNGNGAPAEESVLDTALELTETSQEFWAAGDAEKAIEALDHAYELILKAPADADGQQKDDLRFVISKRLMEIYTSRLTSLSGLNKEIPLVMNEHVEREIRSFQTVERDYFIESYKRSGRYRDEMVKAFHEAGIPEEITWLPLIESGFKVRALSRARALGLWQFIPSTGYRFGLKRTAWVDERLDPDKGTAAAIAYLKELHQIFGDWATVLAAYNCGEGNVFRVIRQQKINYLDNFWDLYGRLPRETARYYPRFLAVLTILKDPAKYGFTLGELDKRIPYEVVAIEKPLQLTKISEKIGCSSENLADLNAELRYAATPNTVYDLKVPFGMKDALLANIASLPAWSPPKSQFVVHKVKRGETLSMIATRYHTSIQKIREANNMKRNKLLRVGQKLKIPSREST